MLDTSAATTSSASGITTDFLMRIREIWTGVQEEESDGNMNDMIIPNMERGSPSRYGNGHGEAFAELLNATARSLNATTTTTTISSSSSSPSFSSSSFFVIHQL